MAGSPTTSSTAPWSCPPAPMRAIRRRIAQAGGKTVEWGEIVGIVSDVDSVYANRRTGAYQLYQPQTQEPRPLSELAVRTTAANPGVVIDGVRAAMAALDADLPV